MVGFFLIFTGGLLVVITPPVLAVQVARGRWNSGLALAWGMSVCCWLLSGTGGALIFWASQEWRLERLLQEKVVTTAPPLDKQGRFQQPLIAKFVREDEGGLIFRNHHGEEVRLRRDPDFKYRFSPGEDVIGVYSLVREDTDVLTRRFYWERTLQSSQ